MLSVLLRQQAYKERRMELFEAVRATMRACVLSSTKRCKI
jgi:hypothetical protein